jgi:hypothetical protein
MTKRFIDCRSSSVLSKRPPPMPLLPQGHVQQRPSPCLRCAGQVCRAGEEWLWLSGCTVVEGPRSWTVQEWRRGLHRYYIPDATREQARELSHCGEAMRSVGESAAGRQCLVGG